MNSIESYNDSILINVGGREFRTSHVTLTTYPNSKIGQLRSKYGPRPYTSKLEPDHVLDRNPDYFAVILDFLRTGKISLPSNLSVIALQRELEFYGLGQYVNASTYDTPVTLPSPAGPNAILSSILPGRRPNAAIDITAEPREVYQQSELMAPIAAMRVDSLSSSTIITAARATPPPQTANVINPAAPYASMAGSFTPGSIPTSTSVATTTFDRIPVSTTNGMVINSTDALDPVSARRQGYEESWATSMACRAAPILTKAMNAGLLRFTVFIDPYGQFKGVPTQLLSASQDLQFWRDFASSFAAAPPGSAQDFSQSFRENFNVTLTASYPTHMRLPGHVVAVVDVDGKQGQESESLSWMLFRVKTVRAEQRQLPYVDRTNLEGSVLESTVGLVLLHGWELHFNMPETLTASKVHERVKSMLHGVIRSEDIMTSLYLLN
ncbi:hypothetical protein O5D80_004373 [Batrachochytrium dendrobatidis]|nr:hypothetical protein O5D80_004373 [Batrachochytrium dendrobatidis]